MAQHERWTDAGLAPKNVRRVAGYPGVPAGPTREAEVRDGDLIVGWIWTDDQAAAGYRDREEAGRAGIIAEGAIRAVFAAAYARGVHVRDLLDPALYASTGYQVTDTRTS